MRAREMKASDTASLEGLTTALAQKCDALVQDCMQAGVGVPVMPVVLVKVNGRNHYVKGLAGTVLGDGTPAIIINAVPTEVELSKPRQNKVAMVTIEKANDPSSHSMIVSTSWPFPKTR